MKVITHQKQKIDYPYIGFVVIYSQYEYYIYSIVVEFPLCLKNYKVTSHLTVIIFSLFFPQKFDHLNSPFYNTKIKANSYV